MATKNSSKRRGNNEGCIYYREDKGLWCASVQVGDSGQNKRRIVYAKTQDELIEKKRKLESSLTTGTYIEPDKMNVQQFLEKWLNDVCVNVLKPSTFRRYKGIINKDLIPALGKTQLQKLTSIQVQTLYSQKLREKLSPSSVRYIHAVLHKALSQGVKWGIINRNVADSVEKPKPAKKEMQVWSREEVDKFLYEAKDHRFYPLFVLALTTGLRQGELLGLQWSDINLDKGVISVKRTLSELGGHLFLGEPKTYTARRVVTLPEVAIKVLKEHRKSQFQKGFINSLWVFTDTKGGMVRALNMVDRSFKPLIKKAGVPNIRFHDLRHTHATILLMQGVNPKLVQERLGHASISLTLDTYSHVLPNMQQEVANKLNEVFSSGK